VLKLKVPHDPTAAALLKVFPVLLSYVLLASYYTERHK